GDRGRLADADDAAGLLVLRLVGPNDDHGDVRGPGQLVPLHVRVEHPAAGRVHDDLLEEAVVQAHDHAAVDLAFPGQLVQDQPGVLDCDDLLDLDYPGLEVHDHFGKLAAADAGAAQTVHEVARLGDRRRSELAASILPRGHGLAPGPDLSLL